MFSSEYKEKLIKELNIQLENNAFYSAPESIDTTFDSLDTFDNFGNTGKFAYGNLANITGFDLTSKVNDNVYNPNVVNTYDKTFEFNGVGLFRPLISNEFNPLNKTVYNYQASYATPINGLAFMGSDGGIVENPLKQVFNVVDNTSELLASKTEDVFSDVKESMNSIEVMHQSSVTTIKPIAYNTYQMSDIIEKTIDSQIIDFNAIPRELALTKPSKIKSVLFKQIDVWGAIKGIFAKNK